MDQLPSRAGIGLFVSYPAGLDPLAWPIHSTTYHCSADYSTSHYISHPKGGGHFSFLYDDCAVFTAVKHTLRFHFEQHDYYTVFVKLFFYMHLFICICLSDTPIFSTLFAWCNEFWYVNRMHVYIQYTVCFSDVCLEWQRARCTVHPFSVMTSVFSFVECYKSLLFCCPLIY